MSLFTFSNTGFPHKKNRAPQCVTAFPIMLF